jgi:hypothetical protein
MTAARQACRRDNPLLQLRVLGQVIWPDFLSCSLSNGDLERLVVNRQRQACLLELQPLVRRQARCRFATLKGADCGGPHARDTG